MFYFKYESNAEIANNYWNNSQFDLSDIVLFLTDRKILWGVKLYAIFCRQEVLNLMNCYLCDFNQMKKDLGIEDEYVERKGLLYDKNFNPKRKLDVNVCRNELAKRAENVYLKLMNDLTKIATDKIF